MSESMFVEADITTEEGRAQLVTFLEDRLENGDDFEKTQALTLKCLVPLFERIAQLRGMPEDDVSVHIRGLAIGLASFLTSMIGMSSTISWGQASLLFSFLTDFQDSLEKHPQTKECGEIFAEALDMMLPLQEKIVTTCEQMIDAIKESQSDTTTIQ